MSLTRLQLPGRSPLLALLAVVILSQHQLVSGLFIWPRLVPYYYPLPVSSSSSSASSSFPSSVHSGNAQYMYDWNTYNQNYPHSSSVLFPSSSSTSAGGGGVSGSSAEQSSSMMPTSGAGAVPSIGHSPFSGLTRWFHKPWLSWKLAKFGLRSPSSSPCSSSIPIGGHSHGHSLTSTLFPSLSSASLTSSSSPTASPSPPCTTRVFTCCNAHSGGPSSSAHPPPPSFIQTHVGYDPHSPTYQDRRISSSGHHYPNNYISYSSGAASAPAASSMEAESVSQVASDPMSISYDFISSR